MTSQADSYAFLLEDPYRLTLDDVAKLTDFQIATLYAVPRDPQTGGRRKAAARRGWWVREDPEAAKSLMYAIGRQVGISTAELDKAWAASRAKKGKAP